MKKYLITINHNYDTIIIGETNMQNKKPTIELKDSDNQAKAEQELLKLLAEAEDDVKNGCISPIDGTFGEIRKIINEDNE